MIYSLHLKSGHYFEIDLYIDLYYELHSEKNTIKYGKLVILNTSKNVK